MNSAENVSVKPVTEMEWEADERLNPAALMAALEANHSHKSDPGRKGCGIEKAIRAYLSCLRSPPTEDLSLRKSIAEVMREESLGGAACCWRSCTGCHETNEGYETGHYPYSEIFNCYLGGGCSECGGIGAVWEYWSEQELEDMARDITSPPTEDGDRVEAVAWQCREIGEGGWVNCSKERHDSLALDPHHDTRTLYTSPRPETVGVSDAMVERACEIYGAEEGSAPDAGRMFRALTAALSPQEGE